MFAWPVGVALEGPFYRAPTFMLAPILVVSAAGTYLWRLHRIPRLASVSRLPLFIRIALATVPVVLFSLLFNVRAVLALLFTGPP